MSNYKKIKTTKEVWLTIKLAHEDLEVFSTYSAPEGDMYGDPNECVMLTEYGFIGCDFPIIGAKTTWDRSPKGSFKRENEKHIYWLCVAIDQDN